MAECKKLTTEPEIFQHMAKPYIIKFKMDLCLIKHHEMTHEGVKVQILNLSTKVEVSGQFHALEALPPRERAPSFLG
jgi:hypothetical protein